MAKKQKPIKDEKLAEIMRHEFDTALGAPGGEIANERAEAYRYYLRKLLKYPDEGLSKVVTADVQEVVDKMLPVLLRIFTTADNLITFDPVGKEDIAQAQQASDYINYIFFKKNPAFENMFFAIFDALVQKTGIFKVWWDESEHVTTETYENLTEDAFVGMMEDDELELEESEEYQGTILDEEIGAYIETTLTKAEFKRTTTRGQVRIEVVPPNEYRKSSDTPSMDPCKGRFVGHERGITRDELLGMGFPEDIVNELPADYVPADTDEKSARNDKSDDQRSKPESTDKSQDMIVLREGYRKIDIDGKGRAELYQVFEAGEKILQKQMVDRQPFHVICPHPLPHKHIGMSTAEKVMDIQEVTTELLRQVLNNLYRTNQPGHGVWDAAMGETTMDDLLTQRVGRVVSFDRPMNEAYSALTVPFTAAETFPMIDYFDRAKRNRSGVSVDTQGLTPEALKNIQSGVLSQATDMDRMQQELIARIFAETGFTTMFKHIYELVIKHQDSVAIFELRGEFVAVNPTAWRERYDVTANIGLGIGTRDHNLIHLNSIWEKQVQMAQNGGLNLTVTPKNFYNTAKEIVRNANLKQEGLFFTDPGDQMAPPPSDEQEELERQQVALQERQQQLDAARREVDAARIRNQREADALKHQREMMDLQIKKENNEAEIMVKMEKLLNEITKLEIESGRNIPGSRV